MLINIWFSGVSYHLVSLKDEYNLIRLFLVGTIFQIPSDIIGHNNSVTKAQASYLLGDFWLLKGIVIAKGIMHWEEAACCSIANKSGIWAAEIKLQNPLKKTKHVLFLG